MNDFFKNITVGMSALNEGSQIEEVIAKLRSEGFEYIVVVDDGSTDDTFEKAKRAGAVVMKHPINCGAGAGVQTIMKLGRKEGWNYLLLMDADGQHYADDVAQLYKKMESEQLDLVVGSRFLKNENRIPRIRRFFNSLGNLLTNAFCKQNFSDTQSGFRLLNHRAIQRIDLLSSGFSFCSEMLFKAEKENLKIGEEPIKVRYTDYSMSKGQTNFMAGFRTAWQFIEQL